MNNFEYIPSSSSLKMAATPEEDRDEFPSWNCGGSGGGGLLYCDGGGGG